LFNQEGLISLWTEKGVNEPAPEQTCQTAHSQTIYNWMSSICGDGRFFDLDLKILWTDPWNMIARDGV
jgi:hypothetical protein